jgi:beta-fructofuranosidase
MTYQAIVPSVGQEPETIAADLSAGTMIHAWIKAARTGVEARLDASVDGAVVGTIVTANPHEFELERLFVETAGEVVLTYDPHLTEVSVVYTFSPSTVLDEGVRVLHVQPSNATPELSGSYHFRPPFGWMNDPNGFGRFGGNLHLFYQHYPHSLRWNNMHWGHAVSEDYLRWKHMPIFLFPSADFLTRADGRGGAFSGSAIALENEDGARIFFTEHMKDRKPEEQVQFTAVTRNLVDAEAAELILPTRPEGLGLTTDFRDPYVFIGPDGRWKMLLGSRDHRGGMILLYETDDPKAARGWTFVGVLYREDRFKMTAAECPCMLPLDGKPDDPNVRWALIFGLLTSRDPATGRRNLTIATVGRFDGRAFTKEFEQELDFGTDAYAFQAFVDRSGPVGISWLANWTDVSKDKDMPTTMTLPRRLLLNGHALLTPPIDAVSSLRTNSLDGGRLLAGKTLDLGNGAVEILLKLSTPGNPFTLTFEHPDVELSLQLSGEGLRIHYALPDGVAPPRYIAAGAQPSIIRIFLDAGSIEVFADAGRWTGTKRLPGLAGVRSARLLANAGDVVEASVWQLAL